MADTAAQVGVDGPLVGLSSPSSRGARRLPVAALVAAGACLTLWLLPAELSVVAAAACVSLLWAVALADGADRPVVIWLPAGLAASVVVPLCASLLWTVGLVPAGPSPGRSWVMLLVALALPLGICGKRAGTVTLVGQMRVPAAVAGLVTALGALAASRPVEIWVRNFSLGTDFDRHLIHVRSMLLGDPIAQMPPETAIHSLIGHLAAVAGLAPELPTLWLATSGVAWLLLVLLLLGVSGACQLAGRNLGLGGAASSTCAAVGAVLVLASPWFAAMIYRGYLTSLFGGLLVAVLSVAVLGAGPTGMTGPAALRDLGTAALATGLAACNWQLMVLPMFVSTAVLTMAWLAVHGRSVRLFGSLVVTALLVTVLGAWAMMAGRTQLTGPIHPDTSGSWWVAVPLLAATLIGLVLLDRLGARVQALALSSYVLGGLATLGWLAATGGWGSLAAPPGLQYYFAKTLWSLALGLLPWAVAAVCALVLTQTGSRRTTLLTAGAAVLVLVSAAVVVPRAGRIVSTGYAGPAWQLAAYEYLTRTDQLGASELLALGVSTSDAGQPTWMRPEVVDYVVMDLRSWAGGAGPTDHVELNVLHRDLPGLCRWLGSASDPVLLTGPDGSGPTLLAGIGCPPASVRAESWVRLTGAWTELAPERSRKFPR